MKQPIQFTLPEYWSRYLVKGDASSLSAAEVAKVITFLESKKIANSLVRVIGNPRFARHDGDNGPACNVLDYSFYLC